MYKYIYVQADAQGIFKQANHREIINKYGNEGWRFVTAIPTLFRGYSTIKKFDLVFEKEM